MKNVVRFFAILLTLASILSVISCGGTPDVSTPKATEPQAPPDDEKDTIDLSEYSVVYSNQLNTKASEAATSVALALTGSEFKAKIDKITDPTELEILIGQTNRPESAEALELAADDTFVIKSVGKKIVINAKKDGVLIAAINCFMKMLKENSFTLPEELEYVSEPVAKITLAENGFTHFNLVYLEGLLTSGGTEGKAELEVQLCRDVRDAIVNAYAATPEIVEDSVKQKYEIIVGETTRKESKEFIASLGYNEYGFEVVGNRIVVAGTNPTTTRLAVDVFIETLKSFSERVGATVNSYLYSGVRLTRCDKRWNVDIPEYEGGEPEGVHDGGNGALMLAYGKTTPAEFEAYCKKLEGEGYELYLRNDIEKNLHATYTHKTRGMIHTYYTASEERVRIVSYLDGKYNLSENKEPGEYERLTDTAITGYGISAGMCYAITLADSSFIIVDGGSGDSADTFYAFLKSQNKRHDGKIIIRAWYLTHEHSDHYTMTNAFLKRYGKQVTIEEFWCNPATVDYTHYVDNRNVMWEESYETYKSYVNGDFKWITLHTGMKFHVANLLFEVLYTEEDIFPRRCKSFNDCILLLKMTDTISGTTMLWTGDLLKNGCQILANNYEGYLKCDILQVPHHGMSEAMPLYKEVLPSVALWPTTDAKKKTNHDIKGGIYAESMDFLDQNVPTNIVANTNFTITIPYKTGDPINVWKTVK
jgi:hypothetical protein